MNAAEFIEVTLRDLHAGLRAELTPLTQEQVLATPAEGVNTIAFLLWHYVRSEDSVLNQQAAGRPAIWVANRWAERLGVTEEGGGTGFTEEQMLSIRPAKEDLLAYCEEVWADVPTILKGVSDVELDRALNPERPTMTLGRSIANFVVGHGFWHLGDIRYTKGLMGMPFAR